MLNYRAFEADIVLKSYCARLIDMFDTTTLYKRLCVEAEQRDLIDCSSGLYFKRNISVKGCHCKLCVGIRIFTKI